MAAEQIQKIMLFGESMGFWIQTGAFFLSAIGAVYVIRANGKQARNRATIDLVLHQRGDEELNAARKIVVELHRQNIPSLTKFIDDPTTPEYKAIQATLNNYEFIASGIRLSAFDEKIYKRMRYSTVMRDWRSLQGLIVEIRRNGNTPTFYQEFEWLCTRWEKNPLKVGPIPWYRTLW